MPITSYQPAEHQQSAAQQQEDANKGLVENYGAVLKFPQRLDILSLPAPPLKNGQVQVQMKLVSVSDADIRLWKYENTSLTMVSNDDNSNVLGCEGAGVVTAVGAHVHNLRVGDRVVVEPCVPCMMCDRCISGRYNLCPDLAILGTATANGLFQKFITHPAPWLHRIPDGVSYQEAALMDPLATVIAALDRTGIGLGQSLLITGGNVLAYLALKVARATGINPIIVAVDNEASRERALSMGADKVYVLDPIQRDHEVASDLRAIVGNDAGIEAAVECTSQEMFLRVAIMATQPGGTCCRIGAGNAEQTIPVSVLAMRGVTLSGVNRSHHVYPRALALVAAGRLQLQDLVSEEYSFDHDLQRAFEAASVNGGVQKVQVKL